MYTAKHEMGAQILNGELGATATRWRRTWLFSPLFSKKRLITWIVVNLKLKQKPWS